MRMLVAIFLMFSGSAGAGRLPRRGHVAPQPQPTFDPAVVNNPATMDNATLHTSGSAVLRAQILMDRAHFSVGEIDGYFGDDMENSVKAYQAAHKIMPADGTLSPDTWKALDADTAPAIVPYTISATDIAGPFYKIPAGMMQQAKLPALGFTSVEEELGERFHSSPKLLARLNQGKDLRKPGEQIMVPNVSRNPLPGPVASVLVVKTCNCVELVDSQNQVIAHYPATMGSLHDPLPIGDWKLEKPMWNPVFHYNPKLFWDANSKDKKAEIKPGPNNPVGVVWIGLSKEHYGIHGTPDPGTIGKAQSHGCIRLTNWDATEVASQVKPGMTASLRAS